MMHVIWGLQVCVIIIITLLQTKALSKCIHDKIHAQESSTAVPQSHLKYEDQVKDYTDDLDSKEKKKRSVEDPYKNIRISVWYHELETELGEEERTKLKNLVTNATRKVKSLFSVIPATSNLLLKRSKTCKVWTSGPNKDKCAAISAKYAGEFCGSYGNGFRIPDEHLEGLFIYDDKTEKPKVTVAKQGAGLNETDFVLYVKARTTKECISAGANVIAYGTFCQVDQYDRPIAGLINFCPALIRDKAVSERKIYMVALHELFHSLGFSKDLFKKFKDCSQTINGQRCIQRKNIIEEVIGRKRLVTPSVVKYTSQHFKCQHANFGSVLQYDKDEETGSHWDPSFLQGSIMAPNIELPRLTILDPITLAAFEDSGWYKVDYGQAQPYIFGSGMGCNFSINCDVDDGYFCTGSSTLCHYKHLHKGECKTDPFLHGCKIYKAIHSEGSCTLPDNAQYRNTDAGEQFDAHSRCYVANLTLQTQPSDGSEMAGHCYVSRCTDNGKLEVKVGGGSWNPCPFGESIQVEDYSGILECPKKGVLCSKKKPTPPQVSPPISTPISRPVNTEQPTPKPEPPGILCIEITFPTAQYQVFVREKKLDEFRDKAIQTVCSQTGLVRGRLANVQLHAGSIIFLFDLKPKKTQIDGPSSAVAYNMLEYSVMSGNFTVYLSSGNYYTAAYIRRLTPNNATDVPYQIPAGGIVGIVLSTMATMGIIVAAICLINKYQTARSRISPSPSRATSVDMSQSDSASRNTITTLRGISVLDSQPHASEILELQQV